MIEEIKVWYSKYKKYVNIGLCVIAIFILFVPELYVKLFYNFDNNEINRFNAINSSRSLIIQFFAGCLAIIGMWLSYRRTKALDKKNDIDEVKNDNDIVAANNNFLLQQYSKAAELLSSNSVASRLSGIYLFEKIMNSHEEYYWQIIELLVAHVNHTRNSDLFWNRDLVAVDSPKIYQLVDGGRFNIVPIEKDIQAILTVIGRRNNDFHKRDKKIEFKNVNLYGCSFREGHFAIINRPFYKRVIFNNVIFVGVDFELSHFLESFFHKCHFESINFNYTVFDTCKFSDTYFYDASCTYTSFVKSLFVNHLFGNLVDLLLKQFEDIEGLVNTRFKNKNLEKELIRHLSNKFLTTIPLNFMKKGAKTEV